MSVATNFEFESPSNISTDSSNIRCTIFNNILTESSTLSRELIGNRFLHLTKSSPLHYVEAEKAKTNLELMDELGLLGAIEDREITSVNRKKFIRKSIKKRYEKESDS